MNIILREFIFPLLHTSPNAQMLELESNQEFFNRKPISPLIEMGAYEALWLEPGISFKNIAERFKQHPGSLPSDFVNPERISQISQRVMDVINKTGIMDFGVRIHGAGEYPKSLRDALEPVELLYYRGWWDLVNFKKKVAVVGTRQLSPEGVLRAKKLVRLLVQHQYVIVSGLARGVDTVAHQTAIEHGGWTIAVPGTPFTEYYPKENRELQDYICDNFLLISQVPILKYQTQDYRLNRFFFPERNKTMSALTEATIIVEAGETSGTLIQAQAALNQGRKLFILDNCFRNSALTWPAAFEAKGAIRVRDFDDILRVLGD